MKIAYVLNTYPQPSHSFIRREIRALERQGCEVVRLAMRPADVPLVDPSDREEADRTDYVLGKGAGRLALSTLGAVARSPIRFAQAFGRALRMGRASSVGVARHLIYLAEAAEVARECTLQDVQHVHAHFGTNSTTVALLAHLLGGPGFSFTAHGPEEFDAPASLSLGEKSDAARFSVGVSQFGRSQLRRWTAFATWPRLHVVHCGIEPDLFVDSQPVPQGPLRLVAIGRFVEQKGQMILIEAMALLRDTHPDIQLTLVGDGPMRPQIEDAIERERLQKSVRLAGWLDEAGVRYELANSHLLVMPSFAEGLPMVVMEAMASARPVLATYIAGTPELVVDGRTGWLVPAGDAEALSEAIVQAAQTEQGKLQEMGEAGRERVLQRHDADQQAARLLDLMKRHLDDGC